MYTCNPNNIETKPNDTQFFEPTRKCRFSDRYVKLHQDSGCRGCPRGWDKEYLTKMGFDVSVETSDV